MVRFGQTFASAALYAVGIDDEAVADSCQPGLDSAEGACRLAETCWRPCFAAVAVLRLLLGVVVDIFGKNY